MAKKKRLRFLIAFIAAVILVIIFMPGYTKLQDLVAENKRLEKKISELTRTVNSLKGENERLENDILYIEKVAREKLGVVREDEVIIKKKP